VLQHFIQIVASVGVLCGHSWLGTTGRPTQHCGVLLRTLNKFFQKSYRTCRSAAPRSTCKWSPGSAVRDRREARVLTQTRGRHDNAIYDANDPEGYEKPTGAMPDAKAVAAMMKYNESLQKAGVLLALDGLHPPSMGARVLSLEEASGNDGPFTETKEVVVGIG